MAGSLLQVPRPRLKQKQRQKQRQKDKRSPAHGLPKVNANGVINVERIMEMVPSHLVPTKKGPTPKAKAKAKAKAEVSESGN
jgi:hypothetical protein